MKPQITSTTPVIRLSTSVRARYQPHLLLADPQFDQPSHINMLIEGEIFPYVIRPETEITHIPGWPSAIDTYLSWILVGTVSSTEIRSSPLTSLAVPNDKPICGYFTTSILECQKLASPPMSTTEV